MKPPPPYIVNVGLPRTGTTSFARATEMLGFKALHIWKPGEHDPETLERFRAHDPEIRQAVEQYHTLSDTPFYALRETFEQYYHTTLILYTTRPKKDWVQSMLNYKVAGGKFLANLYGLPRFPYTTIDKKNLEDLYDAHHKDICHGLPSIDLGNADDSAKWELICSAFPNAKELTEQSKHWRWPHTNRSSYPTDLALAQDISSRLQS